VLTAARRLGERRAESWAEHRLGLLAFQEGDYTAAAAAYTRAAAALEAVGPAPPFTPEASLVFFSLPEVLLALGVCLSQLDDTARAERAFLQSLAAHDTWGDCGADKCVAMGLPASHQSLRQQNCEHLVWLYRGAGAQAKVEARLRMWRALLDEEGVECPGDDDGWLQYAQATAETAADALDIVARARRLYAVDGPWARHPTCARRLNDALCRAATVLAKLGDTDAACELATEAAAKAGSAAVPDAWRMQAGALYRLAEQLRPKLLQGQQPVFDESKNADRVACLRLYCRAAALYPAAARRGAAYSELLDSVQHATHHLYWYDGADALLSDADVVLNLPNGGVARLSEPLGRGFILLSEAILQAKEAHHGAQSPHLATTLLFHAQECHKHGDFFSAVDFSRRHVALCTSAFGALHEVTQFAQYQLDEHAKSLSNTQRSMPAHERTSRDAVHRKGAVVMSAEGVRAVSSAEWADAKATKGAAEAAAKAATRGRSFACAACGALPALKAPAFQKCAACTGVTYCGKECQRAHWPAHRADCKKLRKPKD
jgi:tetratricopeptide (TPR) repeat protein